MVVNVLHFFCFIDFARRALGKSRSGTGRTSIWQRLAASWRRCNSATGESEAPRTYGVVAKVQPCRQKINSVQSLVQVWEKRILQTRQDPPADFLKHTRAVQSNHQRTLRFEPPNFFYACFFYVLFDVDLQKKKDLQRSCNSLERKLKQSKQLAREADSKVEVVPPAVPSTSLMMMLILSCGRLNLTSAPMWPIPWAPSQTITASILSQLTASFESTVESSMQQTLGKFQTEVSTQFIKHSHEITEINEAAEAVAAKVETLEQSHEQLSESVVALQT